jgi:hypothetical protein
VLLTSSPAPDPSFEDFIRASGATPEVQDAALKAIGSGGPRQSLAGPGIRLSLGGVHDEFAGFMDGLRRAGTVPASTADPGYQPARRA